MTFIDKLRSARANAPSGNITLVSKFSDSYGKDSFLASLRKRAFTKNPIMPNTADIVNWVVYDTYKVAAGASVGASFNFYTQPIGTNSKTKMDTNLEQVQRLPDPQFMNVIALGLQFGPEVILADIIKIVNNYYVELWVGNKVYTEGRFEVFPSGTGITGSVAAATTVAATTINSNVLNNGRPGWDNLFDLRLPAGIGLGTQVNPATGERVQAISDGLTGVTILQGQQFKVVATAPGGAQAATAGGAGGAGISIVCQLYGILSRGVQ